MAGQQPAAALLLVVLCSKLQQLLHQVQVAWAQLLLCAARMYLLHLRCLCSRATAAVAAQAAVICGDVGDGAGAAGRWQASCPRLCVYSACKSSGQQPLGPWVLGRVRPKVVWPCCCTGRVLVPSVHYCREAAGFMVSGPPRCMSDAESAELCSGSRQCHSWCINATHVLSKKGH